MLHFSKAFKRWTFWSSITRILSLGFRFFWILDPHCLIRTCFEIVKSWILCYWYSDHLNTEHTKSKRLTFRTIFSPVFKWSDLVIRWTIQISDILDLKTHINNDVNIVWSNVIIHTWFVIRWERLCSKSEKNKVNFKGTHFVTLSTVQRSHWRVTTVRYSDGYYIKFVDQTVYELMQLYFSLFQPTDSPSSLQPNHDRHLSMTTTTCDKKLWF